MKFPFASVTGSRKKMARYKKASRRYARRARRRRYLRRRRLARNAYRRRYRSRYRKSRTEYKRLEGFETVQFKFDMRDVGGRNGYVCGPGWFHCFTIGSAQGWSIHPIMQGTGIDQRIGAKITPVQLRFFGTVNATTQYDFNEGAFEYTYPRSTQLLYVRVIIFQVRNGNTSMNNDEEGFCSINPYCTTLSIDNNYGYNFTDNQFQVNEPGSFNRLFTAPPTFQRVRFQYPTNSNPATFMTVDELNKVNWPTWQNLVRTPFRLGIGPSFKVLKDKLYKIRPALNQSIPFRFKTKRPMRMVWPESPTQENHLALNPRNPIYIMTIPVVSQPTEDMEIFIRYNFQLYYSDK